MFYTYKLIDPATLLPFYIGKGKGKRSQVHFNPSSKGHNKLKDFWIRKIIERGDEVVIEHIPCLSEADAYILERKLILEYGRIDLKTGILTNLQEGGEGAHAGEACSMETRNKCSAVKKSKNRSVTPEQKNSIRQSLTNRGVCTAIIQYSLKGTELARFPSARNASMTTSVDCTHIIRCCKGEYPSAKGYVWRYADPSHTESKQSKYIKKRVAKCDKNWTILEEFESVSAAARSVGTSIAHIGQVSTLNDFAIGFYWKKLD